MLSGRSVRLYLKTVLLMMCVSSFSQWIVACWIFPCRNYCLILYGRLIMLNLILIYFCIEIAV